MDRGAGTTAQEQPFARCDVTIDGGDREQRARAGIAAGRTEIDADDEENRRRAKVRHSLLRSIHCKMTR